MFAKLKLYALAFAMFLLALFGVYFSGRRDGLNESNNKANEKRLDALKTSKKVEEEVRSLDDPTFIDRAGQWVRKDSDK